MTTIIVQSINARTFDAHVVDVLYIYQIDSKSKRNILKIIYRIDILIS